MGFLFFGAVFAEEGDSGRAVLLGLQVPLLALTMLQAELTHLDAPFLIGLQCCAFAVVPTTRWYHPAVYIGSVLETKRADSIKHNAWAKGSNN